MTGWLTQCVVALFTVCAGAVAALIAEPDLSLLMPSARHLKRLGAPQASRRLSRRGWLAIGAAWTVVNLALGSFTWAMVPIAALLASSVLNAGAARRRLIRFEEQFEQAATTLAGGLHAGQSLIQAIGTAEKEYGPPLGGELRTVLRQYQAGIGLEEALAELSRRVPCPETVFFARAITIHNRTGGAIGGVLANLARIVRQRRLLRGEVRARTGEARLTAVVLAVLPPLLGVYMFVADRQLLVPLLETSLGRFGMVYAVVSWLIGVFVINRMVNAVGGT